MKGIALSLGLLAVVSCSSAPSGPNPQVLIATSMGDIKVELFQDKAPITVKNFLDYVDDKFYDNTIFHRVDPNFMIQGGGFTPRMQREKATGPPIRNESYNNLPNLRGTLAMARTNDPNSATSQFFINLVDNDFLDRAKAKDKAGYAVFGKVLDGMDVAEKIGAVEREDLGLHQNVPKEDIIIKSIRRIDVKR